MSRTTRRTLSVFAAAAFVAIAGDLIPGQGCLADGVRAGRDTDVWLAPARQGRRPVGEPVYNPGPGSAPVMISFAKAFDRIQQTNELHRAVQHVPSARLDGDQAETLAAIRSHLEKWGVTAAVLARVLNVRPGVVTLLLDDPNRIPEGPRHTLLRDALRYVERDRRERQLRAERYVPTAVTRLAFGLAQVVRETQTIGLLTGSAGLGKSHALEAVRAELSGETIVVRADMDSRSAKGILRAIGAAANSTTAAVHASVKGGIEAARASNGLLAIDEAHILSTFALEALRGVFDQSDVGLLLVGTRSLGRNLSLRFDPLLGPLVSRIALRCDLDGELLAPGRDGRVRRWIDAATLRAILERHAVGGFDREAATTLLHVANYQAGHLRTAVNAAAVAKCLARRRDDRRANGLIRGDDVRLALRMGGVEGLR